MGMILKEMKKCVFAAIIILLFVSDCYWLLFFFCGGFVFGYIFDR